ncbi:MULTISPECIES: cell division protein FtsQ/DivIB [unclassified Streptococcus]|uniref:cell division protein FtsQ/DivIB n=1 Tax=unclassified Streptococcus TaxID=2608887 RepID=UPI00107208A3|nr:MULTISPECIES: FtsQ-type POTRA domain-containing protein [unclassified Streptococcus]MBF0786834.1 FtsQ-type POTRA domain-containing protein [Streptococcus sp. 19428wC2_LYSM12]MCQ9211074.1 FtsQ-type POTRA domain-containing protein [Streptococcus sp. B01]MCQ9214349.1 FtsQ-type POTRA domain-containing protein [Streptococcus sp. O1]TFV06376.1 FtsQ-type POTRA domain-containing protein [Streptococcus sp. LYSM12]
MTEKDPLEEVKQAAQEEAKSQVEEQAPEVETETEIEMEAESDFLAQWKERHQAYLASQKETESEKEGEKSTAVAPSRPLEATQKEKGEKRKDFDSIHIFQRSESKREAVPTPISRKLLLQASPIIATALIGILLAVYFISPLSKEKKIEVVGNQLLDWETVLAYSKISEKDYALTTLLQTKNIEANIKNSSNIVKSDKITFQFPNRFTIRVEEFMEVGYLKEADNYRLVLSSGDISETVITNEALPERYTSINLVDKALVKELALQLAPIDADILSNIKSIELTPSKVTADLLTMSMYDGNTLLLPLSEIDIKLPYYSNIAKQLSVPSIVDMEVGAFSYAK